MKDQTIINVKIPRRDVTIVKTTNKILKVSKKENIFFNF